jgi:hypothetical protein
MAVAVTIFFDPGWPRRWVRTSSRAQPSTPVRQNLLVPALAALWIAFQWMLPMRQALIPGDPRWTGEGYRFSWNVVATEKTGSLVLWATDPLTAERTPIDPTEYFTPQQLRVAVTEPDLILQMAHVIADETGDVRQLTADAWVSFNGRAPRQLIDPTVDLAALPLGASAAEYVLSGP